MDEKRKRGRRARRAKKKFILERAPKGLDRSGARSYQSMIARCLDERDPSFHVYGGRGITVCERWVRGYQYFLEDMGPRPEGTTLDRIDNSKGYSPDNCRWATWTQQARNRSNSISESKRQQVIDLRYEGLSYSDISYEAGVPSSTAHHIIKTLGCDPKRR